MLMTGCSKDSGDTLDLENNHMARFEESVLLKTLPPVNQGSLKSKGISSNEIYNAFKIENFDSNFVLRKVYVIDGIDYVDTGDFSDEIAGDGVYTSFKPQISTTTKEISKSKIVKSDKFKFNNELLANKLGGEIGCKMRIVHDGESSWFGNSCAGGCIELYDCSFRLRFNLKNTKK
jgi:hypothetical protein